MITCVGKTKDAWIEEGVEEYAKRLSPYALLDYQILKESHGDRVEEAIEEETARLEKALLPGAYRILLDVKGKSFTSEAFAKEVLRKGKDEGKPLQFLIGGAHGVGDSLREKVDLRLSFSEMTMTHQLIRVVLFEQLYRGTTILVGKRYHY